MDAHGKSSWNPERSFECHRHSGECRLPAFLDSCPTPNSPPAIQSSPELQTIAGSRYIYDINAIDPDDDVLAYELVAARAV